MCQSVNVASLTSVVKVQLKSVEALFSLILLGTLARHGRKHDHLGRGQDVKVVNLNLKK